MSEMLKIENIRKVFNPGTINEKVALDGVNLTLEEGEFVTVIGGNGAGKSTILKSLTRQLKLVGGTVYLDQKLMSQMSGKEVAQKLGTISGTCVPGPDDRYGYHNVH